MVFKPKSERTKSGFWVSVFPPHLRWGLPESLCNNDGSISPNVGSSPSHHCAVSTALAARPGAVLSVAAAASCRGANKIPSHLNQRRSEKACTYMYTYVYSPCILYIYIYTQWYICLVHTYIYICRHTIVTINQDLSLQAALPSLQQRLWCSPWVSGKNPKIWPTDSRFQGVSRNGPREFWIPFMSGKHGKTCGKTWLMPIDANWCYVFLIFL